MLSGNSYQAASLSKSAVGVSATFLKVPRDKDTLGLPDLTRVKPMIFKHGLLVKSQDLA
jgi:hypothetical protein